MSYSILDNISYIIKLSKKKHVHYITYGIVGIHCLYAVLTSEMKGIQIKKKYKFDRKGCSNFMIIDENNVHYNMNNSFWYMKYNSIEDWNKVDVDKKYIIHHYGYRVPIMGLFPNCYKIREVGENDTSYMYNFLLQLYRKKNDA